VFRGAAIVVTAAALAFVVAGCGGEGDGESAGKATAIESLYSIDHGGTAPKGGALAPYEKAFDAIWADCGGTVEGLASSILDVASDASNGSGTTVTNLEAMRAISSYLRRQPLPPSGDCRGVFVGVEAYLEGNALG
jgi:hypothetical protein